MDGRKCLHVSLELELGHHIIEVSVRVRNVVTLHDSTNTHILYQLSEQYVFLLQTVDPLSCQAVPVHDHIKICCSTFISLPNYAPSHHVNNDTIDPIINQ